MKSVKKVLFSRIKDGYVEHVVRSFHKGERYNEGTGQWSTYLFFHKNEDEVVSRTKIDKPVLKWNGEPLVDYLLSEDYSHQTWKQVNYADLQGYLTYKQICEIISKKDIFVFNDFTHVSERMWESLMRL